MIWIVLLIILVLAMALISALIVIFGTGAIVAVNSALNYVCKSVTSSPVEAENLANITGFIIISVGVCIPLYSLTGPIGPAIFLILFSIYRQRNS